MTRQIVPRPLHLNLNSYAFTLYVRLMFKMVPRNIGLNSLHYLSEGSHDLSSITIFFYYCVNRVTHDDRRLSGIQDDYRSAPASAAESFQAARGSFGEFVDVLPGSDARAAAGYRRNYFRVTDGRNSIDGPDEGNSSLTSTGNKVYVRGVQMLLQINVRHHRWPHCSRREIN